MDRKLAQSNAHHLAQPDAVGRWWFQGKSVKNTGAVITTVSVQNRPFEVLLLEGRLIPTDPETRTPYEGSELVGWWQLE